MRKKEYLGHILTSVLFVIFVFLISILFGERLLEVSVFEFFIMSLATFRLTHLFVYDTVMDFVRDYFARFGGGLGKSASELIHCPWCTSIWAALFILTIHLAVPLSNFFILVLALAGSGIILEKIILRLK